VKELRAINTDGFGAVDNLGITAILNAGNYVFLAISNPTLGATIYRSTDGEDWELISSHGIIGNSANTIVLSLVWFNEALYAGTWQLLTPSLGARLFRANAKARDVNDIEWEPVTLDGFGNLNNNAFTSGIVFDGYIYFGAFNPSEGTEMWRSKTGDPDDWEMCARGDMQGELPWTWEKVMTGGSGSPRNQTIFSMAVLDDRIYVGCIGSHLGMLGSELREGKLLTSEDGVDWTEIKNADFISGRIWGVGSLATYQGKLYIGLYAPLLLPLGARCQLWVYEPLQ